MEMMMLIADTLCFSYLTHDAAYVLAAGDET